MSNKIIEQKYIVLATKTEGSHDILFKLLSCDSWAIQEFVKGLPFGTEIDIKFFSIDKLNEKEILAAHGYEAKAVMDNSRSFSDFYSEITTIIENLEIEELPNDQT